MEVTAQYLGDSKFEVAARGHRVICDQPIENGGSDEGMTPPEFLLASLASCVAYYAAQYLEARKLPTEDLAVKVTAEKGAHPARLSSFHIDVSAPALDENRASRFIAGREGVLDSQHASRKAGHRSCDPCGGVGDGLVINLKWRRHSLRIPQQTSVLSAPIYAWCSPGGRANV